MDDEESMHVNDGSGCAYLSPNRKEGGREREREGRNDSVKKVSGKDNGHTLRKCGCRQHN